VTTIQKWTGREARALREALRMSIRDFAARLGISDRAVSKWEAGGSAMIPRPDSQALLDTTLETASRDVRARFELFIATEPPANDGELAPGPAAGRKPGFAGDSVQVPAADGDQGAGEDVFDVLGRVQKLHRGTVHPEIMAVLQDNLRHTVADYEQLDHASLVPVLLKQRAWIEEILGECSHPGQRQQLFEIAGATSGVLGYVAVGRGDFPLARAYCLEAFQLGDFADNAGLQAWARGMQSFCEYYAGRYREALRLAEDGLSHAQSGPQSVRLTINGAARALGKLGDAEGVHRAVDQAYELMSRNDVPTGVPSSIAFDCYSAAQTASNATTAYVSLGLPDKAQHYAGLALPDISISGSPWSRSLVMIDLALSLIRAPQADLDQATELMLSALAISADRPVISVRQRTSEFVGDVTSRWGKTQQAAAILEAHGGHGG
jgi:transcriptional regulator with XRE-family HTH domain/tetratricopeptide (TPR) repeat protein